MKMFPEVVDQLFRGESEELVTLSAIPWHVGFSLHVVTLLRLL